MRKTPGELGEPNHGICQYVRTRAELGGIEQQRRLATGNWDAAVGWTMGLFLLWRTGLGWLNTREMTIAMESETEGINQMGREERKLKKRKGKGKTTTTDVVLLM